MNQNMPRRAGHRFLSAKLLMKITGICLLIASLQVDAHAFTPSPNIKGPVAPAEIKGRVVNENGEPVAGASVMIKGSTQGTRTSDDGDFTLTYNNSNKATLIISAVGYANTEVAINNQLTITVTLKKSSAELDEVIVAAYGTAKKSAYSGAATVVSGEKIQKIQSSNVGQALQGMSPGVQVLNTNGQPGSDGSILIRGLSSMQNNTDPLFILDGMPYSGSLSAINPSDIESFTVLKDASATSLYGSRAANGVIVITTKKGGSVAKVNFRSNFGYSDFAVRFPEKVTSVQLYELGWEALRNGKLDEGWSEAAAAQFATDNITLRFFQQARQNVFDDPKPIGLDGKMKPGVKQLFAGDWFGEMFRQSLRQEYSLDFSGSAGQGQKTQYFLSASYLKDNGNMTVQKFDRISARANVNSDVKSWLKVGTSIAYTSSFTQNPSVGTRFIRVMPEVYPVYVWDYEKGEYQKDGNGKLIPDFGDTTRTEWRGWNTRFVGDFQNEDNWNFSGTQYDLLTTRSFAEIKFMPGLTFRTAISTDLGNNATQSYSSSTIGTAVGNGGSASRSFNRRFSYTINNLLTYDKSFGEHHLNVLVGQESYKLRYIAANASRRGFPLPGIYEMSAASTQVSSGSSEDNYRLRSYLSKVEYSWMNRYFITGSFRTDGSSRFHPDHRWGKFWSASASWKFSDEAFMESIDWIQNAKIRASYGTTGNDNVGYYAYQGLYATGYNFMDLAGAILSRLPTPNLQWESNAQTDIGLDFTLFNKVHINVDWFSRMSKDLIFNRPLPPSTGNSGIDENIGDVKNYGWEFDVNTNIIANKNFRWNFDMNASSYKNKIVRLPQKEIYSGRYKWTEGVSRYEFYGPLWAGVNPENGNNTWWKFEDDGKMVRTEVYADVNTVDQQRYLGTSIPDWFGSITNTFNYSGFDFSFMFYYSLGGKMYDNDYAEGVRWRRGFNLSTQILERWTPENTNTKIPRISEFTQSNITVYSNQYLFNNTFVRLRNVTLGYTLPAAVLKRLHLGSFRVFAQGTNLLTWGAAARRGTDPETSINGAVGDGANGSGAAPTYKSYSLGLQISL